jgi:hypothetical protein
MRIYKHISPFIFIKKQNQKNQYNQRNQCSKTTSAAISQDILSVQ